MQIWWVKLRGYAGLVHECSDHVFFFADQLGVCPTFPRF